MESILSANVARVFAETDAFAAAIARNRPWRALCLQTWQGFSPKRMLSLPRLHEIGPGEHSVCKRGKAFRPNGCSHCRDCTKSALEDTLSANVARVFAKSDAFTAAIAQNRPWRAVCMQTWQGFSPKRTHSLPRLHEIGHGGRCVCKRGKGRKGYPLPACLRRRQHQQHSHRKQQRHRPHSHRHRHQQHSHRHRHQQHSLHDGLTAQGCCHGSKRWDDDRKKRLKRRHGSKEWDDGSTQELRRPPYFAARIALCQNAIYHQGIKLSSHQGIKLSSHQGIKPSSHQSIRPSGHQGIRASDHQGIKPSGHQTIKPSSQSKKPGHSPGTSAEARAS